jgi:hypothetical protein
LLSEVIHVFQRIIEGLLSQSNGLVSLVEDLVVTDGEVEGETETDGVGSGDLAIAVVGVIGAGVGKIESLLIESTCVVVVTAGNTHKLGEVTIVIASHLEVEDTVLLGERRLSMISRDEKIREKSEDLVGNGSQLLFELLEVDLDVDVLSLIAVLLGSSLKCSP